MGLWFCIIYSDSQNRSEGSVALTDEEPSEDSQPLIRWSRNQPDRSVTSRPSPSEPAPIRPSSSTPSITRGTGTTSGSNVPLRLQDLQVQWAVSNGLKEEVDRCIAIIVQEDEQAGPSEDRWSRARAKAPKDERGNFRSTRYLDPDNHHWTSVRWADVKENDGPANSALDPDFLQRAYAKRFDVRAGELYGFGSSFGYWFEVPNPSDRAYSPPRFRIPIYVAHLELGVRFPLHPFMVELLKIVGH